MKRPFYALLLLLPPAFLPALDLWQYPEAADKHAMFLSGYIAALSFSEGFVLGVPSGYEEAPNDSVFAHAPAFTFDYMLPFGLPLSLGLYMATPNPNLKHFGIRSAYHFDIEKEKIDLYFLYCFDFGWLRNDVLAEYGDTTVEMRFFDFRAGVRYLFGKFIALTIETGHYLKCISFGVSIKLN
ncbi:MAG: hypothetical protein LBD20_00955 [Spirochaetaceae bacterium]|nr:hypothetical protein [Spirochaetaceae bacterium]